MARQRKPRPIPLADVRAGDAFLAPLLDGRLSVCRVLQVAPEHDSVLVVATPWIGTLPPDLAELQLRKRLRLTHHAHGGGLCLLWVSQPVPATFTRLGVIPPTAKEAGLTCAAFSGWEYFPGQVFLQWRWDHERDKVLAEDEAKRRAEETAREGQRRAYKPLPPQTLEELRAQTPFPHWAGYVEPSALRGARRIIRETIDALIRLGPDASEPARLDEINRCVQRFNALDVDEDRFIETIEREDIGEFMDGLAAVLGLDDYGGHLIGDRDW
jgi:hypothetical protein